MLQRLVGAHIERMARRAALRPAEAGETRARRLKHQERAVDLILSGQRAPRADDGERLSDRLRREANERAPILRPDRIARRPERLGRGRAQRIKIGDDKSARAFAPREADAAANRRIVLFSVGRRRIEHDEGQQRRIAPSAREAVTIGAARGDDGRSFHLAREGGKASHKLSLRKNHADDRTTIQLPVTLSEGRRRPIELARRCYPTAREMSNLAQPRITMTLQAGLYLITASQETAWVFSAVEADTRLPLELAQLQ